jgi:hypothetical protein
MWLWGLRKLTPLPGIRKERVPTGVSLFLLLFPFFVPVPAFHKEISHQDRLETTITDSVDPLYPRLCPSHFPFPKQIAAGI